MSEPKEEEKGPLEKKRYILTDGAEVFGEMEMTELELVVEQRRAKEASDGNLSWTEVSEAQKDGEK